MQIQMCQELTAKEFQRLKTRAHGTWLLVCYVCHGIKVNSQACFFTVSLWWLGSVVNHWSLTEIKGEVRTINDRNICGRRSCMKNNGKSPTFKFVSGEERRSSEVQRVSRSWRLRGATHSSVDLIWIRKWLEIQALELSELESVKLELGNCCSDLDKQVSDEICRTQKRHLRSHFVFRPRHAPEWLRARFFPSSFSQTKKNWPERLLPRPSTPQTLTHMWNWFSSELLL